ncbi:MAG: exodeoxyribonuclease VII large subunit [Candidatus Saccharibacteria bacterium]
MEKIQYSVSDFIAITNQTLDYAYPSVEIEGEVASFKVNQAKFIFFDIKDAGGSLGCFMTVWQLRVPIEDGMKVIVTATPKLTQWGKFSLTVKAVRPSGEGALKKSFELLKAKLDGEGLFLPSRKRVLPTIPRRVALISSTQSAGYADFIKIVNDRWVGLRIDVAHVQVQGVESPDQIIRALSYFNQRDELPEVIVVIRGGGSADDLAAFNDERLVRAIAGSRIPTLVGVGHETDESLADMVADVRAATPSNAAQILVPDKNEIIRATRYQVQSLLPRVDNAVDQQLALVKASLAGMLTRTELNIEQRLEQLGSLRRVVSQLNPRTILARGYALIRGRQKVGSTIEIETYKTIIKAEVKNVQTK